MTLHHLGIEIAPADVDRAVKFFVLLGFEQVQPPAALSDGFTWLERAGTQVHLMHEEQPIVPSRAHLAVVVPDFEATLARLHENGFETRPGRQHWGAARAHAIAPGGHRVELMAAPPAHQT
ncbi:MAG TPA: VOC family protein [Solirubrobacterales bacterium]|nr:VOC family protein [Solirubrobacterales bacterium]